MVRFGLRAKLLLALMLCSVVPTAVMWIIVIGSLNTFSAILVRSVDAEAAQIIAIESGQLLFKLGLVNLAVVGALVGVILIASKRLSSMFASPIIELAGAMSAFEEGQAPDIPVDSSDEVGQLAGKFVTMADTISTLRENLELFRARLEAASRPDVSAGFSDDELVRNKEAELKKALAGLQELNANTDDLLSLVRHELKTPLTSIIASTEALVSGLPFTPEKKESFIYIIQDEARRLTRLLNDVLDTSRLDGTDAPLSKRPLDLAEFVHHVVRANQPLAEAKGIKISTLPAPADERLSRVPADRDRLTQLLTNILDNAVKFTPSGGRVTVGLDAIQRKVRGQPRTFARVQVTDTGPGIDPRMRKKVFEKYQKLQSVQAQPEGQGLGLAIAKWIALAHGGKIWFTSRPGAGATFYFTLPL